MSAGLLHTGRIWRLYEIQDDSVGGAVPTGTVIFEPVFARIFQEKPTLALKEQGLETPTLLSAHLQPGNIQLQNNDQLEITGPNISPYRNKFFVIISDPASSILDSRGFWKVLLRRFDIAHSNRLQ